MWSFSFIDRLVSLSPWKVLRWTKETKDVLTLLRQILFRLKCYTNEKDRPIGRPTDCVPIALSILWCCLQPAIPHHIIRTPRESLSVGRWSLFLFSVAPSHHAQRYRIRYHLFLKQRAEKFVSGKFLQFCSAHNMTSYMTHV